MNPYLRCFKAPSCIVVFLFFVTPLLAQEASPEPHNHPGLIRDWSHRHLLYTNGGSAEKVAAAQRDPRLLQAWLGRTLHGAAIPRAIANIREDSNFDDANRRHHGRHRGPRPPLSVNSEIDWALPLGAVAGMASGQSPAKYNFDISANPDCANDFVVFTINAPPTAGIQANIVAINNLYAGTSPAGLCGSAPTFLWAYAAGVGGASSSPVLSLDGRKVAFIEYSAIDRAELHVLTWVAGQGTNATTGSVAPGTDGSLDLDVDYTNITNAGCTAAPSTVGQSSPYIDYGNDAAFVTANNGRLYRIKDVFNGTPALDFCITVRNGATLNSPVYDSASNTVYVSDDKSVYAYSVGTSSFSLTASHQVTSFAGAIKTAPIVDSTNGFVYLLAGTDSSTVNTVVAQLPLSLSSVVQTVIGQAPTATPQLDFDNQYYANGPATGTMYACGSQITDNSVGALFSITFAANGVMNAAPAMSNDLKVEPSGGAGRCTATMEFYDGTNDRLFVSTSGASAVTMWNINSRITSSSTTPTASATPYLGGTSGFVVDNTSSQAQAASIYFGTLSTGATASCGAGQYCAVKLTQGALQ